MTVIDALTNNTQLQRDPEVQHEMEVTMAFAAKVKKLPMVAAAEYLKYWKAQEVYVEQTVPLNKRQVRRTYFINAWANLEGAGGFMVPLDGVITSLLLKLGSMPKPGPPPKTTQERKMQNSLERLLRSARHRR
ncbi:unnamed protein product [Prorocentrum cordatum]|uniref:Uncharacterized protein n=1 Tax=Prorocentrum cordatum TaxID=2364126 RepID=A0ABN9R4C8_9DINO|nr:unnamed protein product [Polarella glacialis]